MALFLALWMTMWEGTSKLGGCHWSQWLNIYCFSTREWIGDWRAQVAFSIWGSLPIHRTVVKNHQKISPLRSEKLYYEVSPKLLPPLEFKVIKNGLKSCKKQGDFVRDFSTLWCDAWRVVNKHDWCCCIKIALVAIVMKALESLYVWLRRGKK